MTVSTRVVESSGRSRLKFTIPVYPHVKKFILKKFRLSNPVRTEESSTFGKLITLMLDNRSKQLSFSTDLWETLNDLQTQQALMAERLKELEAKKLG